MHIVLVDTQSVKPAHGTFFDRSMFYVSVEAMSVDDVPQILCHMKSIVRIKLRYFR